MAILEYLFDTNILSALIKNSSGELAQRVMKLDDGSFCTSIIVACELRFGADEKVRGN